jgi:hypothetical protein
MRRIKLLHGSTLTACADGRAVDAAGQDWDETWGRNGKAKL